MLELVGLVLILMVLFYAISKGMIDDLARPYMSSARRFVDSRAMPRIPDTYQPEPPTNQVVLRGSEPVPNRDADIVYLAQRREPDGSHTYSANAIAELIKGTRTETLAKIRAARGEPDPAAPTRRQIAMRQSGDERLVEVDW